MVSSIAVHCLHRVKWFQELLFSSNNSINNLFARRWRFWSIVISPFPVQNGSSLVQNGNSSFQNGSSSVQNGNSSVQNGKIIISINIKNIL